MATTSIWRVGGWLGKVVIYVENPDKTENPAPMKNLIWKGATPRASRMSSNTLSNSKRRKKSQPMTKELPSCSGLCPG
mgnify:CR=1 FL=1